MRYVRSTVLVLAIVCAALGTAAFALQRHPAPAAGARLTQHAAVIHPRIHERWRVALGGDVGLPAADHAGVVVTVGESQVAAVSNDGAVEWTTAVDGALANAPRIDDDLVFVAATRVVVALQRETGAVVWSVPTTDSEDDNRANRPVVADDTVVVTAADGLVLGLDRGTGAERWRTILATALTSEPAVGDNGDDPPVVAVVGVAEWWGLDPATGATLWSGDIGLYGTSSPIVYAVGYDTVAAVATDEHLIAVDARTGALRWSVKAEQSELYQVPVLGANGIELIVPDHWGRVTSFRKDDGKRFWSSNGANTVAEFGEPVWLGEQFVALPLDGHGPRLASPAGSFRLRPPADGFGVAELPLGGLVVTTAGGTTNYVLVYDVSYH
jgi:outer membrane protein assembly factor BamB